MLCLSHFTMLSRFSGWWVIRQQLETRTLRITSYSTRARIMEFFIAHALWPVRDSASKIRKKFIGQMCSIPSRLALFSHPFLDSIGLSSSSSLKNRLFSDQIGSKCLSCAFSALFWWKRQNMISLNPMRCKQRCYLSFLMFLELWSSAGCFD